MKRVLSIILISVFMFTLTACGGRHSSFTIHAKNLITEESVKIHMKVEDCADTSPFSTFTVRFNKNEFMDELSKKNNVNNVTDINDEYFRLDTDSGAFFVKCNTLEYSDKYSYCLLQM